jgi:uncharacterized protein involved in exopolysaccharide biosynthesis
MDAPLQLLRRLRNRFASNEPKPGLPLDLAAQVRAVSDFAEERRADGGSRPNGSWLQRLTGSLLSPTEVSPLAAKRLDEAGQTRDFAPPSRPGSALVYGLAAIWIPIAVYLVAAPSRYTSQLALILPGAGVSTSINLSDIGQASSTASSPYASASLSPTVLYKNLLESVGVVERAAHSMGMKPTEFGKPFVKLIDETSLIHFDMTGRSPEDARERAMAVLNALLAELDKLRADEIKNRELAAKGSIGAYEAAVDSVRTKISALQSESGLNSGEQYAGIVTATEALQVRVAETQAALDDKEASVRSLSNLLRISADMAAATLKAVADPELSSLSAAAAKDSSDVAELEQRFGAKHPKFLEAQSRALGTRTRMIARVATLTGFSPDEIRDHIDLTPTGERVTLLARLLTLSTERDGLAGQLKSQNEELQKNRARVHTLLEVASRLETLNRDYKVADAVFTSALARNNASKTDIFASYPMLQVAEPATMPHERSSPNLLIATGAGAAASLLLLIGLTLASLRRPLIRKIVEAREPSVEAPGYAASRAFP